MEQHFRCLMKNSPTHAFISFFARFTSLVVLSGVVGSFLGCIHVPKTALASYHVPFNCSGDFRIENVVFCFYQDYYSWRIECYEEWEYKGTVLTNDLLRPKRWHGIQDADYFYHYSNKTNMMDRTVVIPVRDHALELRMRFTDIVIENCEVESGAIDLSIYAIRNQGSKGIDH